MSERNISWGDLEYRQRRVCKRYKTPHFPSPPHLKVGISDNVRTGTYPINGLRHLPEGDTTGWHLWAGEDLFTDADFFRPLHVAHLESWSPEILEFLGLPPGWRFLIAPGYVDVWFDPSLLATESR